MSTRTKADDEVVDKCLSGGGAAGELARSVDWSKTPLGPVAQWSQALRSTASLVLHNHSAMLLWWGPEFVQLYNDAYRPVLGDKHPRAMGQRFKDCWAEVFHILGPMAERPFRGGPASTSDDIAVPINRKVFREEAHFRLAYSPVPDETAAETGIGGVLATVAEITDQAYADRQIRTLRDLGARSAAEGKTAEQACAAAAATLQANAWDVPFALFYLLDERGERAHLAAHVGFDEAALDQAAPPVVELAAAACAWPIADVANTRQMVTVSSLAHCQDALPPSPWNELPREAVTLPLASPDHASAYGVLVCGVSPHRVLDASYQTFFELAAAQVVTAIRNARAYETERRRAEALAEIDRAKTTFFSNVSHEFRTPLTLMLGPVADGLADTANPLPPAQAERQALVLRNGQRLQKLVNTLLDFARIEAGRAQASYEPTDLAQLTAELSSAFESAVARGGLTFEVACAPLPEPVFVDHEMWEKIVLNLTSNAFKFTFEGAIRVALRAVDGKAELTVSDSGVGIPETELPHLFERFHRVQGTRSRTHEGSGIGLALVNELVKLHGGDIRVASRQGTGTTFTVSIPFGSAHLPQERIAAPRNPVASEGAVPFVNEALRWLPNDHAPAEDASPSLAAERSARILLADDNADMREYVRRIFADRWQVDAVANGAEALEHVRRSRPDLVLADVMMPVLDGFGLLAELRKDPDLASLPVVLLSARAGEEARVEGLQAGADDYLVKPFSARELRARVATHLQSAEQRAAADLERKKLYSLFMNAPAFVCVQRGPEHVYEFVNDRYVQLVGKRDLVGRSVRDALPEIADQGYYELLDRVYQTGEPFVGNEARLLLSREPSELRELFVNFVYQPTFGHTGLVDGIATFGFEVSEQVGARKEIDDARRQAVSANRTKDEFLAMLGHELRNPLAPILTALHLMRLRASPDGAKERLVIERQVDHLVRLVDDLLDVSRITSGKVELKKQTIEIAEIVAKAVEMTSPLLEQRRQRFTIDVAAHGLTVEADPIRLAQVISNLLTNAAKYTEAEGSITITGAREASEIVVRVRDTGIGISPDMLPRVFELFSQERQALDRSQGGLGLGLAIVRSLVAMHGGSVSATSEGRGRGSEFVIRLPAVAHMIAGAEGRPSQPPTRVEGKRRVLIVDDNIDAAEMLAQVLAELGCTTRIAHDGPSALRIIESFAADVALLDIGLPVMDGYELARRLRELPALTHVKLVAVTGYGQESDRERSALAGFDQHLVKPLKFEALEAVLAGNAPDTE